MDDDWQNEYLGKTFLKVRDDGQVHTITVFGPPSKEVSKISGKEQNVFQAEIDGVRGVLSPPKTLGKMIVNFYSAKKTWPITFKVQRTGMGIKDTVFRLV